MKTKTSRLRIDAERREVFVDGARVALAPKEYSLLALLVEKPKCWTREQLLEEIWGEGGLDLATRTLDQHVARLRVKLHGKSSGRLGGNPGRGIQSIIETVPGHGYRIAPGV